MTPTIATTKTYLLSLALLASVVFASASAAVEVPPLKNILSDYARMMPAASAHDLEERLNRFKTETGYTVAVVIVKSLEGEDIGSVAQRVFKSLPLNDSNLEKSVLLVVARKERAIAVQTGSELRKLFPEPAASKKLLAQVAIYSDGLRPDLGIYGAVHYIFRAIRGDVLVSGETEEEKLEEASKRGAEAGAIFAVCLAPFLAFFAGGLWGIYATQYGVQRTTRLVMGAIFGGGTAKIVATLMTLMGNYSDSLWYFIMAVSIPLGVFGSLTEFWMFGDWSGIPRVKDPIKRKPEDNIGI